MTPQVPLHFAYGTTCTVIGHFYVCSREAARGAVRRGALSLYTTCVQYVCTSACCVDCYPDRRLAAHVEKSQTRTATPCMMPARTSPYVYGLQANSTLKKKKEQVAASNKSKPSFSVWIFCSVLY